MRIDQIKVISTYDVDSLTDKVNEFIEKHAGSYVVVDIQYQTSFKSTTSMMQYSAMIRYNKIV